MKNTTESPQDSQGPNERVYRQMPTISALEDLIKEMPRENQALVKNVVEEIRSVVTDVVKAGGVIYIGDVAKRVKTIDLRPEAAALKEFIILAAEEEKLDSGVDLLAAVIHRCVGSTSRFYITPEMNEEEVKKARRSWAVALEKVHKYFGEAVDGDDESHLESAA